MDNRKEFLTQEFKKRFQAEPEVWTRAPGRVDLMGSHTDYNLGYVMTMTIDRDTWLAAAPRTDRKVNIYSLDMKSGAEFSLDDLSKDEKTSWTNYVRAIAKYCMEAGYELNGFNAIVHSTVPFSAGLSSSAALEMAIAMTFQAVSGFMMDPVEMALIGQKAENKFIGVNSGILDQYSSAMGEVGKTILLDCRALTHSMVDISPELNVVICDTKAKRSLLGSEYDDRRNQCEAGVEILQKSRPEIEALRDVSFEEFDAAKDQIPDVVRKRCQFILDENQRVLDLARLLSENDGEGLKKTFTASYLGARDLFEISAPAMEEMYQSMLNASGVVAARQTGAGFGGCMVALVRPETVGAFSASVISEYKERTGLDAEIYAVQASDGASIIEG
ncbi:MAG: galactokinase [Chloroflexi bacterium]|nr:galactokinase [Chloroflexota bacterium]